MTKRRALPAARLALWSSAAGLALPAAAGADILPPADFLAPTLAPVSPNAEGGNFRSVVDGLLGDNTPEDRAFTLTPSIGVQELVTDNVFQVANPRQADLVTSILPVLSLSGQSRLIQANVTYAPQVQLYAATSQQDQVAQFFNGSTQVTAVPDTLFFTGHAYGSQQSAVGGYGQSSLPFYSNQNRINTLSFDASPYVTHRFGGLGTAQAGYVFSYTDIAGNAPFNSLVTPLQPPNRLLLTNPLLAQNFANGSTVSNEEYASLTTGENFGRFNDSLRVDAVQYSGTGNTVLAGAYNNTVIDNAGYGINRTVAALGSVGYEDINYGGTNPYRINDIIWSGGVRLTPNERSTIVVSYGHRDGFNSPQASASYAVTARLRVFASYTAGLTTSQQQIQNNVDSTTVDQYGNSIDTATGAPALISDQLLPLQNALFRLSQFSGTAVLSYDRDIFSLNAQVEQQKFISSGFAGLGFSNRGVSGTGSWTHELSPVLSGTASVFYSSITSATIPVTSYQTLGLNLQTGYAFSPTLTGTAGYYGTYQSANVAGQNILVNAVLVGLRKSL